MTDAGDKSSRGGSGDGGGGEYPHKFVLTSFTHFVWCDVCGFVSLFFFV